MLSIGRFGSAHCVSKCVTSFPVRHCLGYVTSCIPSRRVCLCLSLSVKTIASLQNVLLHFIHLYPFMCKSCVLVSHKTLTNLPKVVIRAGTAMHALSRQIWEIYDPCHAASERASERHRNIDVWKTVHEMGTIGW